MLDPRVLDQMLPLLKGVYGNASSTEHVYGWEANEAVNNAREQIANLINCSPNEIVFTSGATESNNISILGVMNNFRDSHAITIKTEHKSILDVFKQLEKNNIHVSYLDVCEDGILNLNTLYDSVNPNTKLISIMMANNEIGVIQPIKEIGEILVSSKNKKVKKKNKNVIYVNFDRDTVH